MPQVALSSDFLKAFAQIPRKKQKTVREALEKFKRDPTTSGQNYEPIHDMRDSKVHTLRCGIDYRAVVIQPPQGDVYLFVWVDHHDESMAWAKRKRFEINKHTGTLQVYEVIEGEAERESAVSGIESNAIPEGRLFSGHDDTTLLLFGVPEPLLVAVRSLRTEEDLDGLAAYLPKEAVDALYCLAAGYSAEQTIDELDRRKPTANADEPEFDLEDYAAALERPETQSQFKVVEDSHELANILNAPLAQWRIFLHPSQRKLIQILAKGPVRVLGGAGTGKTVVAMHRAKHLALSCPPDKKILFTTFTRNLAADIQSQLETLCGDEISQIEVVHLNAWATNILKTRGVTVRIASDDQRNEAWSDALADAPDELSPRFCQDEWRLVVQPQSCLTEADYLRARRAGRGTRLSRAQRKQLWKIFSDYRRNLQRLGVMEHDDTLREARLLLESGNLPFRYHAVVADEVQDLSEAGLKLIRALMPEQENDLFLVGDAHQRIYGHRASLSRCGINVRGRRSKRLRLNYRTTQKIRNWAVALLRGVSVDDLDEGTDDALKGYHSLRLGVSPAVSFCSNEHEEAQFVVQQLEHWITQQGRAPSDICLVSRTRKALETRYQPMLEAAGHAVHVVKTEAAAEGEGVRLATMHRVKGLEFPCVLVTGAQAGTLPLELPEYSDETARSDHHDSERRLLFVAATRARDELVITGYGAPSPLLRA